MLFIAAHTMNKVHFFCLCWKQNMFAEKKHTKMHHQFWYFDKYERRRVSNYFSSNQFLMFHGIVVGIYLKMCPSSSSTVFFNSFILTSCISLLCMQKIKKKYFHKSIAMSGEKLKAFTWWEFRFHWCQMKLQ